MRLSFSHMLDVRSIGLKEISTAHLRRAGAMIALYRDPRDIAVSFYFQLTRREGSLAPDAMTVGEFMMNPGLGLPLVKAHGERLAYYERFFPRVCRLHYEDLARDPEGELARVLGFLGLGDPDPGDLAASIAACRFETMRECERRDAYGTFRLRAVDQGDPESFKVRRGKIGGYRDYLGADEIAAVDAYVARHFPPAVLRAGDGRSEEAGLRRRA